MKSSCPVDFLDLLRPGVLYKQAERKFRLKILFPETKKGKGGRIMENQIKWERDLKVALSRARGENKQVLLFFHNPN